MLNDLRVKSQHVFFTIVLEYPEIHSIRNMLKTIEVLREIISVPIMDCFEMISYITCTNANTV